MSLRDRWRSSPSIRLSFGPDEKITFTARESPNTRFTWLFGDGTEAHGSKVKHRFADADGTQLDGANGAGRFRVILNAEDNENRGDWAAQGMVVVSPKWHEAVPTPGPMLPGLAFQDLCRSAWTELPDFSAETPVISGNALQPQCRRPGVHEVWRRLGWCGFSTYPPTVATPSTFDGSRWRAPRH